MKKFIAFAAAILFVGILSLSLVAFSHDDPRKKESAKTEQCNKHENPGTGSAETKACCKESVETASGGCQKSADCPHHTEKTEEVK
jgi:hypothetical protein